jgi:hypothetical protein
MIRAGRDKTPTRSVAEWSRVGGLERIESGLWATKATHRDRWPGPDEGQTASMVTMSTPRNYNNI